MIECKCEKCKVIYEETADEIKVTVINYDKREIATLSDLVSGSQSIFEMGDEV